MIIILCVMSSHAISTTSISTSQVLSGRINAYIQYNLSLNIPSPPPSLYLSQNSQYKQLNRQLSITPRTPRQNLQPPTNVRPHDRNIPRKLSNCNQKVAEKDKQAV